MRMRDRKKMGVARAAAWIVMMSVLGAGALVAGARAQTDCADGNGVLDMTPPKNMTAEQLIQKFSAEETKVRQARTQYTYTQDVLVQTLNDKSAADGQFHEIATISYDDKGKRMEHVSFGEQSTLRQVSLNFNGG